MYPGNQRGFRAENPFGECWSQEEGQLVGGVGHDGLVRMFECQFDEADDRRVMELLTFGDLMPIHGREVVGFHVMEGGVVRLVGLYHHFAGYLFASRASAHLRQQLESPFERAEIREGEQCVGVEDAHHANAVEIKTFGHHLCAHEDVGFVLLKVRDYLLVAVFGAGGVEVHTGDVCVGEDLRQGLLHLFGAEALHRDVGAVARGTLVRHGNGVPAVVAFQQVGALVVGERHIAVFAGGHGLAGVADHAHGVTPPVLEQDDLLFFI